MHPVVLSGIRPSFPGLSQSAGQITHVLLTRSPLEHPRKGLSVRLACVKHAASVRPEPGSNSPNKNHSEKPDKHHKPDKKTTPNHGDGQMRQKTNNKQKPPNTLLSSQTTHPPRPPNKPTALGRVLVVRTGKESTGVGLPLGCHRARRTGRVATASLSYWRDWPESNNALGRTFRLDRVIQHARPRQYSACRGAAPATAGAGSPLARATSSRCRSARC